MAVDRSKSLVMARRLKELRNERGLSHESLRKELEEKYEIDISIDSLKNYEVSKTPHSKAYKNEGMRVEYLRCLADFYSVSADYLLGISDVRSQNPDITMISENTGLSEKNATLLKIAQSVVAINLGEKISEEDKQNIDALRDGLNLNGYPIKDRLVVRFGLVFQKFVNDLMDIIADDEGILFDFGSMLDAARTPGGTDYSFDPELEDKLIAHGKRSLTAKEFVRFMSSEISQNIDLAFLKRY